VFNPLRSSTKEDEKSPFSQGSADSIHKLPFSKPGPGALANDFEGILPRLSKAEDTCR
jgi:hypothetical protein